MKKDNRNVKIANNLRNTGLLDFKLGMHANQDIGDQNIEPSLNSEHLNHFSNFDLSPGAPGVQKGVCRAQNGNFSDFLTFLIN